MTWNTYILPSYYARIALMWHLHDVPSRSESNAKELDVCLQLRPLSLHSLKVLCPMFVHVHSAILCAILNKPCLR